VKPKDVLPGWPTQSAWMRVQCCATMVQPFMSDEDYLKLRTAICKWNLDSEPSKASEASLRRYGKR
jgi:hypothetical protein